MNRDNEKLLVYFGDEEHLVRRLGAAVMSCWAEIPEVIKTKLIDRAKQVADEHESEQLDDQIRAFITEHDPSHAAAPDRA